jgi:SAM-dependent methyltransferase
MYGIGDNLHQRAILRELLPRHDVWLETCHVALYHDLVEQGLRLRFQGTRLRAQARTIQRERSRYQYSSEPVPRGAQARKIWYNKPEIDKTGSILGAIYHAVGLQMGDRPDFSLPIRDEWRDAARKLIRGWPVNGKPLMIYRPIVFRPEWDGRPRNPDTTAYQKLYDQIRQRFFVVSVADLEPGREWIVGPEALVDVKLHAGELDFETMAALFAEADLVFANAGFGPVLAQAVGTPVVIVYGGRESYRTTERAGAHLAPTLGIDPDCPCDCHSNKHRCVKHITLAPAIERLEKFVDQTLETPRTLLFATTYVDCADRAKLTDHWISLHKRLNPECDLLIVDSASPWPRLIDEGKHGAFAPHTPGAREKQMLHVFPDNVGHLSRGGRDGWGRAFCYGLQAAVDGGYSYAVHVEGDSLLRLPVAPIVRRMAREGTRVASAPVVGMKRDYSNWVETGLMFFSTSYLVESSFVAHYDWSTRGGTPTPEVVIRKMIGTDLKLMPWRAWRGDKNQITHQNVASLGLDWITHCHTDSWAYDKFVESLDAPPPAEPPSTAVRINFGCGTNRLPGWKNHDAEVDIRRRLPYEDNSADFIFTEHCVEHVKYYEAIEFLRECRRVLRPGGALRITVPSIEMIMRCNDKEYYKFTTKFQKVGPTARGAMHAILYSHGHQTAWTESLMEATLYYVGFRGIARHSPGQSDRPELRGAEGHHRVIGEHFNSIESLCMEAEVEK